MIRTWSGLALVALMLASWSLPAVAADAGDPNGDWKWTFTTPDGQEVPLVLTLKWEDNKLSGKVSMNDDSTEISDGTFVDNNLNFNVVREQDGQKLTAKFQGKLEGDAITGKIDVEFDGNNLSFDWNAMRDKK